MNKLGNTYQVTLRMMVCVSLVWLGYTPAVAASTNGPCFSAAKKAAAHTGVPERVLRAITQTETGRQHNGAHRPWPWTINTKGRGQWLADRSQLLETALSNLASGVTSFDVGCFQINYRWHKQGFDSLDQMIDPDANALYAAEFLKSLFAESGDWTVAAGAYHSRTEVYANRYKAKFLKHYRANENAAGNEQSAYLQQNITSARVNRYPLLQTAGPSGSLGSLVPVSHD